MHRAARSDASAGALGLHETFHACPFQFILDRPHAREHLTEAAEALAPVVPCVLALRTLKANGWLFISHMSTSVGGVPAVTVFALP